MSNTVNQDYCHKVEEYIMTVSFYIKKFLILF